MSDSTTSTGRAPQDSESRLAQALAEFVDLESREEVVDIAAFCGRYPELGEELRQALESWVEMGALAQADTAEAGERAAELPERLSGHKILGEIGAGGMGRVLLALDERLRRKVAIKTLAPRFRDNAALRTRFLQEAQALARLSHPNIVHIYNLGEPEEEPHFVMEFVEGVPLDAAVRALTLEQKVELMRKVAHAVHFLHEHGLLHRDIKPGNILVGPDLEPKLLDFGLAMHADVLGSRPTVPGDLVGTPNYFSPEQTRGVELDVRSDVFALGTVLYELLTGALPFQGATLGEQLHAIREQDPVLPRRHQPAIPRDLQNIVMKALEKKPADRYPTAREMAADLERFLAGELVLASPASYAGMMSARVERHLKELEGWKQDQILSESEFDAFQKQYRRLAEPEDAWIMQARRLSLPQVSLYLGAWVLVVAAALTFLFEYRNLPAWTAVALVGLAAAPTGFLGLRHWRAERLRIGVAYLLAFCLLVPTFFLVSFQKLHWLTAPTKGDAGLEIFGGLLPASGIAPTNAQLWWALALALPVILWVRWCTKSAAFSLVFSVLAGIFSQATLARMGAIGWDAGRYFRALMPIAAGYLVVAYLLERRRLPGDSQYFYPLGVLFTYAALSGSAYEEYDYNILKSLVGPLIAGAKADTIGLYFIANAGIYYALHRVCGLARTEQMRMVAKAFRFIIPSHILISLFYLQMDAYKKWQAHLGDTGLRFETRLYEIALPVVACLFVFGSISKQMKNYLAMGLVFLAVGVYRLQQDLLAGRAVWPITLLLAGALLMLVAVRYSALKLALLRWLRRKS